MKGKKISNTLSILTSDERLRLVKFVKGEVSGKETELVRMMELAAKKNAILWEDSKVWSALYGSLPFDQQKYNHNCSRLLALISPFLPILHFLRDESRVELARLQVFNHRDAHSEFERLYDNISKRFTDKLYPEPEDLFLDFQLQLEKHHFLVSNPNIHLKDNLLQVTKSFDQYWLIQKLQLACYNSVHQKVTGDPIHDPFIQHIHQFADNNPEFAQVPVIHFYRVLFKVIDGNSITDGRDFIDFIRNESQRIPFEVVARAFDLLVSYLTRCLNLDGDNKDIQKLFEFIYNWGFSDQWVYLKGKLRPEHFKNRVILFIKMRKYQEATEFINLYQNSLDDSIREGLVEFVSIYLSLRENKLEGIEGRIAASKSSNPFYQIAIRMMLIEVRYENYWKNPAEYRNVGVLNYLEQLANQLKNLRKKITENTQIHDYHKTTYCDRIRYMSRLIYAEDFPEKLKKLKAEVLNACLDDSYWIKRQIDIRLGNIEK